MMRLRLLLKICLIAPCAANAQLVINEVDYDQPGTDATEYIELRNSGGTVFPLQYVQVVMVNGNAGGAAVYRTLNGTSWPALPAGGYFVICANAATPNCNEVVTPATNLIQNGSPDAIALVLTEPTPTIIDALSYGGSVPGYTEGDGTSAEDTNISPGVSIGRYPDGTDTDNNATDFRLMCSTPGQANVIDPVQCDLSTALPAAAPAPVQGLLVLPSPDGTGVLVFDANAAGERVALDLFAADGSWVASRGATTAQRISWQVDLSGLRGRLLLVRITSPTRQETRRFVLP
ncbi:MAG: lamin tail domain-containing protein [Flavobacteriales bacterium]|nr:lamin tail domain-containing protein [Flavobacteriales bacterium]